MRQVLHLLRGALYARNGSFAAGLPLVDEAIRLSEAGVRELTLIGQNVNAYHGEGPDGTIWTLSRLLYRLAEIPGIARLRYTTSHPRDMDDALILTHGDLPALMPSLHLPVQSGSDRVLEAMNRNTRRTITAESSRASGSASPASPSRPTSSSASRERPMRISPTPCGWCRKSALRSRFRSNTARARARPPRSGTIRCRRRSRQSGWRSCKSCWKPKGWLTISRQSGRVLTFLFEKPGRLPGQMAGKSPYLQPVQFDTERSVWARSPGFESYGQAAAACLGN